jgi:acyl transferase domain-containing protein/acyl carrier protein
LAAVSLAGELEDWLKCRLSPTLIYEYPTIAALSQFLAEDSLSAEQGAVQKTQSNRNTIQPASESVHDIAIIGMGCRFPGAENPEAFWELLQSGGDAIGEVPGDRWNPHLASHQGGFLSQVQGFDSSFFGIAPSEADQIDPQHRLLLEVAWEALEDAGQPAEKLSGSETGVFVGISSQDYAQMQSHTEVNTYAATGNAHGMVANRLSYLLNLQGPSLAVDTACSSSLVAVHLACQSLRSGECDLALAGGVNLMLSPMLSTALAQAGMLSPEGRCKTFDASADGYGRGEGCGVVVLKPLSLALEAGDRILATIKGSAVNQDGLSNGLTAPNGLAQQRVIQKALQKAGVSPDQISYVEAHGTGTSLGDPIELSALKAVLMEGRSPNQSCAIGSVKPNIGHLEAAAGIAGLIKTVLALQHRQIPPQLHLEQLNPKISLEASPFFISTSLQDWHRCTDKSEATDEYQLEHLALPHPSPPLAKGREQYSPVSPLTKGGLRGVMQDAGKKSDLCLNGSQILTDNPQNDNQRLAGVSSFGFGGTNAHVILAEASAIEIQIARQMEQKLSCQLLPLSARSPVALQTLAQNYRVFLQSETAQTYSLTDICYTASVRRSHHSNRLAVVGHSYSELAEQLDIFLQKATHTTKDSESQPEESTSLQSLAKFYQLGYPVDWSRLYPQGSCVPLPTYPWQRQRHWFCPSIPPLASVVELQQAKTQPSPHRLTRDRLLATPECDRLGLLESYFQQRLSRILGMGAAQLSIHAPLQTIGLDSLMVLELKHNLETDLKLTLGVSEFLDCPSLAQLASRVLATLTPPTSSSNISWEEGLL